MAGSSAKRRCTAISSTIAEGPACVGCSMEDLLAQSATRIAWTYFEQSMPRIPDLQHVLLSEHGKEAASSDFGGEPSGPSSVATEMCHLPVKGQPGVLSDDQ